MLNIGVISLGIGKSHADGIVRSSKARLAALCDIDEEKLKTRAAEYGVTKISTDYHDMLNDPEIDAVCVTSPDHFHLQMVVDALRAGKHVLCEKPLALHVDECKEMIRVSQETGKLLMVGQVCRVAPGFAKAKSFIEEGLLGDVYFIESEYAHDYVDIKGWRKDPANMRHPVTGGGCHAVDLVRWLANKEPVEAFSYSTHEALTDWPCDDCTIALLKFDEKLMGKVLVSTGCKRNYTMRTVIYGTKGTIIVDNTSPTMSLFLEEIAGEKKMYGTKCINIEQKIPVKIANHNVAAEIDEFVECILTNTQPRISAEEGARAVAACEAIIKSSATGKPEPIVY